MKLRYSPTTYARNMEKLEKLKRQTEIQAQEIKALRHVIQALEGLFFRGSDQHPEAMKKLQYAQQTLSRFHARHRQVRIGSKHTGHIPDGQIHQQFPI